MPAASLSTSAQLYQRLRVNDPGLFCLRITPSISIPHVSDVLLSNSTVTQVILCCGGPSSTVPLHRGNHSAAVSLEDFGNLLASLHHLPLKVLNVSDLNLSEAHMNHVIDLIGACKGLQRLDLSRNYVSVETARKLGAAIASHHQPGLKTLELVSCSLGDAGLAALLGAMGPEKCPMESLNLAYDLITNNVGGKALSEFVLENTTLLSVSTKGNFILDSERRSAIDLALSRNLESKKTKAKNHRPSSALGFLSSLDQQAAAEAPAEKKSSGDVKPTSRRASFAAAEAAKLAAACPSLELLSRQLEEENQH